MKRVLLISLIVALGGCAQVTGGKKSSGVGFGSGEDDYKESPCACNEIPQKFKRFYRG